MTASVRLDFRDAEVGEVHHCDFVAAGVRGGGAGALAGAVPGIRRGHGVGADGGRGGDLVRDFPDAAEADVDLRVRA